MTNVRELLEHGDLLDDIRFMVYDMEEDDHFVLAHRYQHDVFHPHRCNATGFEFEWCYHTVGECMELRDKAQTFRIVFRYVQHKDFYGSGSDDWNWFRFTQIDRVDGDHEAINRYFMMLRLSAA